MSDKIAIFNGKSIRRTIHNNEWWFSISDVVEVISESTDVKQYIKKIRSRDSELNSYWGTICTPLTMTAKDGKKRKIENCKRGMESNMNNQTKIASRNTASKYLNKLVDIGILEKEKISNEFIFKNIALYNLIKD